MNKKYFKGTQWRVKENDAVGVLIGVTTPRNPKSRSHGTHKVISLMLPDNTKRTFLKHEIEYIVEPDEKSKKNAEIVILCERLTQSLQNECLYAEDAKRLDETINYTYINKKMVAMPHYQCSLRGALFSAREIGKIAGTIFRSREELVRDK